MKETIRQASVNEYTQEEWWSGPSARLVFVAMWLLGIVGFLFRALIHSLAPLGGTIFAFAQRSPQGDRAPQLILTLDKAVGSLNLAVANRSRTDIWAEDVRVDLLDVEADGERYVPAQTVLRIRDLVTPSETLHVSLINTIYNAAGRPQGVYSCIISAVLRYRLDATDQKEFNQPFPPYRVRMIALVPISLQKMRSSEKSPRSPKREETPPLGRRKQDKCTRRSQRVTAQSAVVVEGRFSDGTAFSNFTVALVLSAHGCLVTLPKTVDIGGSVVVRNICTLQEKRCQVVYVRGSDDGDIQVGLGFELEAPEFWGIDRLPIIGGQMV